ncbi:ferredoxin [Mycobacterium sp. 48b]|uniref:ferredoxin n=1 Tax=Mycobacterium sp. 48b TaxID=3400426 RepID=UPI003AAF5A75
MKANGAEYRGGRQIIEVSVADDVMSVRVDVGLCEANGVCSGLAPEVFDLDDQDQLTVLQPVVEPPIQHRVLDAARQCPRQAIDVASA